MTHWPEEKQLPLYAFDSFTCKFVGPGYGLPLCGDKKRITDKKKGRLGHWLRLDSHPAWHAMKLM